MHKYFACSTYKRPLVTILTKGYTCATLGYSSGQIVHGEFQEEPGQATRRKDPMTLKIHPTPAPSTHEAVMERVAANVAKREHPSAAIEAVIREEGGVIWTAPKIAPREVPKISHEERQRRLAINNAASVFPELHTH